ncbi:hypothetical protein BRADI_3g42884v3 [Brachypodium distachyon]|uniref:Uncharacterized protein n=1 Tax=Brachypodium distachyon TaxID=15368 RepID=A0A2K2D2Q9_BRADI|nr:hypothetical protein BRADI_3g42884v3 [Brachypodium distachyon]
MSVAEELMGEITVYNFLKDRWKFGVVFPPHLKDSSVEILGVRVYQRRKFTGKTYGSKA